VRDIRFVTFQRRRPDGKIDNCPEDIPADEIGSWADVIRPFGGGEYKVVGKGKNRKVVARYPAAPDEWLLFDRPPKPFLVRSARRCARGVAEPTLVPEPAPAPAPAPTRAEEIAAEVVRELHASRVTPVSSTEGLLLEMIKQNAETTRTLLTAALGQRAATPPRPDPTKFARALLCELMQWRAAVTRQPSPQPQSSISEQVSTLKALLDLARPVPAPPSQSFVGEFKDLVTTISKEDAAARVARANPSGVPESGPAPSRLVVVPGVGLVNVLESELPGSATVPTWSPSAGAPAAAAPAPAPVRLGNVAAEVAFPPPEVTSVSPSVRKSSTDARGSGGSPTAVAAAAPAPQPTMQSAAAAVPTLEVSPARPATPVRVKDSIDSLERNPAVEALLRELRSAAYSNTMAAPSAATAAVSSQAPIASAATRSAPEPPSVARPAGVTNRPAEPLGAALLAAVLACTLSWPKAGAAEGPGQSAGVGADAPAIEDAPASASDVLPPAAPISEDVPPAPLEPEVAAGDASAGACAEPPAPVLDLASLGPSDVSPATTSEASASPAVIELPERMPVPVPLPPLWASDDISDTQVGGPEEVLVAPDEPESGVAVLHVLGEVEPDDPRALATGCAPTERQAVPTLDVANPGCREVSPEATTEAPVLPTVFEPAERIPIAVLLPLWGSDDTVRDEQSDGGRQGGVPTESGDGLFPVAREGDREDLPRAPVDVPVAGDSASDARPDLPPVPVLDRENSGDDAARSKGSSDAADGAWEPAAVIVLPERMPVPVPLPPLWASDDDVDEWTREHEGAPQASQPYIDGAFVPGDVAVSEDSMTPRPFSDADLASAREAAP
jgi:hypothetical protein